MPMRRFSQSRSAAVQIWLAARAGAADPAEDRGLDVVPQGE